MLNENEISLNLRLYAIFYDSHCTVSPPYILVTWRWPSRRAETCRQPNNKDNNVQTVVFWLTNILASFAYVDTTGMMHLKERYIVRDATVTLHQNPKSSYSPVSGNWTSVFQFVATVSASDMWGSNCIYVENKWNRTLWYNCILSLNRKIWSYMSKISEIGRYGTLKRT
jgi:hypothetical protein